MEATDKNTALGAPEDNNRSGQTQLSVNYGAAETSAVNKLSQPDDQPETERQSESGNGTIVLPDECGDSLWDDVLAQNP